MQYSIGIPVRNEENTLESTVYSALQQSVVPTRVYICVNASTDKTQKIVYKLQHTCDQVIALKSDPGKPNAWLTIVENSKADHIWMVDGDVLLHPRGAEHYLNILANEPDLPIIGGSYQELAVQKTFFSYVGNKNSQSIITPPSITGRNYFMNKKKIFEIAKTLNVPVMPTSIINEDEYLDALVRTVEEIKVSADAYVLINPITSFADWYATVHRVALGSKQLRESYPQLKSYRQDVKINLLSQMKKFQSTKGISRKVGLTGLVLMRKFLECYLNHADVMYDNVWKIPSSTKIRFPTNLKAFPNNSRT